MMSQDKIRILIVDDSLLIRELMQDILTEIPDFEVVGTAAGGKEALRIVQKSAVDVITLDVQMPEMDGIETLEKILSTKPLPVIMVSATTQLGADTTLQALELGAMDYIAKPEGLAAAQTTLKAELARKIRSVAGANLEKVLELRRKRADKRKLRKSSATTQLTAVANSKTSLNKSNLIPAASADKSPFENFSFEDKCIAIGISTGGPPALATLFESLPSEMPPIVIVQHMPANFTKSFAARLNLLSDLSVKEAETGDILKPSCVYLAPGGMHLKLVAHRIKQTKIEIYYDDYVSSHRPSADVMMTSAAKIFGRNCLGIIMTGMGHDGAKGCQAIKESGGFVLGQDEQSSDVYGMNRVAHINGHVDQQFSLDNAVKAINKQITRQWGPAKVG